MSMNSASDLKALLARLGYDPPPLAGWTSGSRQAQPVEPGPSLVAIVTLVCEPLTHRSFRRLVQVAGGERLSVTSST